MDWLVHVQIHQSMHQADACMCPERVFGAVIVSTVTEPAPVVDGHVEITEQLVVVVQNSSDHCFGNFPGNGVSDIFYPMQV